MEVFKLTVCMILYTVVVLVLFSYIRSPKVITKLECAFCGNIDFKVKEQTRIQGTNTFKTRASCCNCHSIVEIHEIWKVNHVAEKKILSRR